MLEALELYGSSRCQLQAKTAAGLPQEDPASRASSSSSDEEGRNGKAPEGDEKASFSGRTGTGKGESSTPKGNRPGVSTRLWNAYNFVRKEVGLSGSGQLHLSHRGASFEHSCSCSLKMPSIAMSSTENDVSDLGNGLAGFLIIV